jgi:hypothetical protein
MTKSSLFKILIVIVLFCALFLRFNVQLPLSLAIAAGLYLFFGVTGIVDDFTQPKYSRPEYVRSRKYGYIAVRLLLWPRFR